MISIYSGYDAKDFSVAGNPAGPPSHRVPVLVKFVVGSWLREWVEIGPHLQKQGLARVAIIIIIIIIHTCASDGSQVPYFWK